MKFSTCFLILLLFSLNSFSMMRAPRLAKPAAQLTNQDCSSKPDPLAHLSAIQRLICKRALEAGYSIEEAGCENPNVSLIGGESARTVSDDPNTEEAKIAEAVGPAVICGGEVGTLSIVEIEGKKYLLGSAHGVNRAFEKNTCSDSYGEFLPDVHYLNNPSSGFDFAKSYRFKLPPLNYATTQRAKQNGRYNVEDFVFLEIEDTELLKRQNGEERKFFTIYEETEQTKLNPRNTFIMSNRDNYKERIETSYEEGCLIKRSRFSGYLNHYCDTGSGTSGAPLLHRFSNGEIKVLGVHKSGVDPDSLESHSDTLKAGNGNHFIPSSKVLETFRSLNLD